MKSERIAAWGAGIIAGMGLIAACGGQQRPSMEAAVEEVRPVLREAQTTPKEQARELRGVWLTNVDSDVLMSREQIAEAMQLLADCNINVVFPVVWNKAYTMYPSAVMEREFGRPIDPLYEGRDPLAEVIAEAHARGIEVIPWFEYGFASFYNTEEEPNGGFLLQQRPQWASLDQEGVITRKNNFEWMNPFDPEVQEFMTSLVLEVAEKYDVDGIQGDDRMPALPTYGGYEPATVAAYREEFGEDPPADYKDPQWVQWRADILTEWFADLRQRVKAINSNLIVSSSPSPYDWSLFEYLQDSKTWVERGIPDMVHPQAYRRDLADYQSMIDDMVENVYPDTYGKVLYPGILAKSGSYVIPAETLAEKIAFNRSRNISGEVLFFYEALTRNDFAIATMLQQGPYANPARVPHRGDRHWRPGGLVYSPDSSTAQGPWVADPGATTFRITGGTYGEIEIPIEVPHSGFYNVYTWLPAENGDLASEAIYTIMAGDNRASARPVDQSAAVNRGLVPLGFMYFEENGDSSVIVRAVEADAQRQTLAGRVMLLLNRKLSPEVRWNPDTPVWNPQ